MQQQPAPNQPNIPDSCQTVFLAGGGVWSVDEKIEDVMEAFEAFRLGNGKALELHADHKPIYFSRTLIDSWSVAWPIRRAQVARPSAAEVVALQQREGQRR